MNGQFPPDMGLLTSLTELSIVKQQISGTISSWIGNMSNLVVLRLYENQLSGSLPSSIYRLPLLENLSLRDNKFSGSVSPDLGQLRSLTSLYLSNNQLTGSIPTSISGVSSLSKFFVLELIPPLGQRLSLILTPFSFIGTFIQHPQLRWFLCWRKQPNGNNSCRNVHSSELAVCWSFYESIFRGFTVKRSTMEELARNVPSQ